MTVFTGQTKEVSADSTEPSGKTANKRLAKRKSTGLKRTTSEVKKTAPDSRAQA
jgi:hypothetical protein